MANPCRINGYLIPKHVDENKLNNMVKFMRRTQKKEWLVLDDVTLKLHSFADEASASKGKREPIYTISLVAAALGIESSQDNTFYVTKGKKYIFQAETHNAMMVWLACLQSCRGTTLSESGLDECFSNFRKESTMSIVSDVSTLSGSTHKNSEISLLRTPLKDYTFTSATTGRLRKQFSITESVHSETWETSTSPGSANKSNDDKSLVFTFSNDKLNETSPNYETLSLKLQEAHIREKLLLNLVNSKDMEWDSSWSLTNSPELNKKQNVHPDDTLSTLKDENLFLKAELLQVQEMVKTDADKLRTVQKNYRNLESILMELQIAYASLLRACCTFKVDGSMNLMHSPEFKITPSQRHMIGNLLDEARKEDPCLPSISLLSTEQTHTDAYGYLHTFPSEDLALLYMSSNLFRFYTIRSSKESLRVMEWAKLLTQDFKLLPKKKLKNLCRKGIPGSVREQAWKKLILYGLQKYNNDKIGRSRYYQTLVDRVNDTQVDYTHRRQIMLDVVRTFPDHVAFHRPENAGVQQMQEVLQAFTIHNPMVGYCQGMNFIVGNASIFLDKETTFWLLVLFVEHHFSPNYFNAGLISAQADQNVLRDLLIRYSPALTQHLQSLEVDIATISFNWFIAIFVSAIPIETLVRIWDVFLLEGVKVLFRISLALLIRLEPILLRQTDTLALWKCIKNATSLTYDSDELLKMAFSGFKMIKRKELKSRREEQTKELQKRLRQIAFIPVDNFSLSNQPNAVQTNVPARLYSVTALGEATSSFLLCFADDSGERCGVKIGNAEEDKIQQIDIQFDAPILSATHLHGNHVLLGSAESYLYAFNTERHYKTWELKTISPVTAIAVSTRSDATHAFIGMSNGALSFIENVTCDSQPRDQFTLFLGVLAISTIAIYKDQVWCAFGGLVEIFDVNTLDHLHQLKVSENPLDIVLCLSPGQQGLWISKAGDTVLQLWSAETFKTIANCDIKKHIPSNRKRQSDEEGESPDRITAVLASENVLIIGTGLGSVFIYKVLQWKSVKLGPATRTRSISLRRTNTQSDMMAYRASDDETTKTASDVETLKHQSVNSISPAVSPAFDHNSSDCTLALAGRTSPVTLPNGRPNVLKATSQQNPINLLLASRCQVTESPIRAFIQVTTKRGVCLVSFSERSSEDDSILRWMPLIKGGTSWTNFPILEVSTKTSTVVLPNYMQNPIFTAPLSQTEQTSVKNGQPMKPPLPSPLTPPR